MNTLSRQEYREQAKAKKTRKYRNTPTIIDGIRFDSKREGRRYCELRVLERAGDISALRRQPKYVLITEGVEVGQYVGDFEYVDKSGTLVTEDIKSPATARIRLFAWKKKHFAAQYGREIRVVK